MHLSGRADVMDPDYDWEPNPDLSFLYPNEKPVRVRELVIAYVVFGMSLVGLITLAAYWPKGL